MIESRRVVGLLVTLACACTASPEVVVVASRELGPVDFSQTSTQTNTETRAGGRSVFGFGRSVWLFGATQLTSPDTQGASVRANGWSHTPDLAADDGIDLFETPVDAWGGPAELIPATAEELAFNQTNTDLRLQVWPLAAVRDDVGDRILLLYAKHRTTATGQTTPIGSGLAAWIDFEFGPIRPVLDAGSDEPTLLFHAPEPPFGQAAVVIGERLYAYGCTDDLYQPCMLARVELDAVFERGAWRFWTGREWGSKLTDAAPVFEAFEAQTGLSVLYNPHVDRYLAVHGEAQTGEVSLRSALAPEGPWSAPTLAFTAAAPIADVLAHPEYRRSAGRFEYFSYRSANELRLVEIEVEIELAPGD